MNTRPYSASLAFSAGAVLGNLLPFSMPSRPMSRASLRHCSSGMSPPISTMSSLDQQIGLAPIRIIRLLPVRPRAAASARSLALRRRGGPARSASPASWSPQGRPEYSTSTSIQNSSSVFRPLGRGSRHECGRRRSGHPSSRSNLFDRAAGLHDWLAANLLDRYGDRYRDASLDGPMLGGRASRRRGRGVRTALRTAPSSGVQCRKIDMDETIHLC